MGRLGCLRATLHRDLGVVTVEGSGCFYFVLNIFDFVRASFSGSDTGRST